MHISGVNLYKSVHIAYTDHFFGYKRLRIAHSNHLSQHLIPAHDRAKKLRPGDIGLVFVLIVGCGMKLRTVTPDGFQLTFKNCRSIIHKTGLIKPVLYEMKYVFGSPLILRAAL